PSCPSRASLPSAAFRSLPGSATSIVSSPITAPIRSWSRPCARKTLTSRSSRRAPALSLLCAVAFMLAAGAIGARAQTAPAVRVWEGELALPTTVEGPANPNPPFDQFVLGRFNYPYALRDALTDRERVERYKALFLENEFLKVTVLPELGGHLYSCLDKTSGRQMFYANPSIKKALIGYRGAWAAFGIEFNFPVSH